MAEDRDSARMMYGLMARLWPLHRTLNSDDTERAVGLCGEYLQGLPFSIHRYRPGTQVLGWPVPERYKVNEAWLEVAGERVADFAKNPLHLLSYSLSQNIDGQLRDIREHVWTSRKRPNAIPWEFKYYERSWGFCLRQSDLDRFREDSPVCGRIDANFTDEDMVLGECYLPGESGKDLLFITNICHPMQVNDSLTGLVVGLEMAFLLSRQERRRYGFRLLVVPETIGTLAWVDGHRVEMGRTEFAWFCEMVGHDNSFILQHSRQGEIALIDRAFLVVLRQNQVHGETRTGVFRKVVASDEMVTNGPGIDIPTPSLTRWPYDEYHTSDDNPSIVSPTNLQETLKVFLELWQAMEENYYPQRNFVGPVMLSRYGLWVDWRIDWELNLATESIMTMLEGDKSIIDIAYALKLSFGVVRRYIDRLHDAGLIRKRTVPWGDQAPMLNP